MRCGRPVCTNARTNCAIHIDGLTALTRGPSWRGIAVDGSSKTAIMLSPIRLTIRPPESRIGGSRCATFRSNRSVASSPAASDQSEKPQGR